MPKKHKPGTLHKLTEEERRILAEFKAAFKDAEYPDKGQRSWFQLDDERVLLKFLRARDFDVAESTKMLKSHLEFRRKWKPHTLSFSDKAIFEGMRVNGGIWRLAGTDRNGVPVELIQVDRFHVKDVTSEEDFMRIVIAENEYRNNLLFLWEPREHPERGEQVETAYAMFDLKNFSLFDQGSPSGLKYTSMLIKIAQGEYPETLEKCFVLNAPWVFRTAWAVIQPWLDEDTASRINFITDTKALQQWIAPEQLYAAYGGTKTDEYPIPLARAGGDAVGRPESASQVASPPLEHVSNSSIPGSPVPLA